MTTVSLRYLLKSKDNRVLVSKDAKVLAAEFLILERIKQIAVTNK